MEKGFQLVFIITLFAIFYQDLRERKVTLLLFVLGMLLGGLMFYKNSFTELFLINIGINFGVVFIMFLILLLYARLFLNKKLLETIGLGDFLFFIVIAFSFPTVTFLILLSTSLIFSLFLFLTLKLSLETKTIPLAGLQSFFISLVLIMNWFFNFVDIYAL